MTSRAIAKIDVSWQMNGSTANATFDLMAGVTALIGPSGAGKTTLARILCGLKDDASGSIAFNGKTLLDTTIKPQLFVKARNIGLVMQDPALFPTMTVHDNIMLGNNLSDGELNILLRITDTARLMERMPTTLSGGEARRVATARAMAARPSMLILDEPMNGLDPKRRREIMTLVRTLAHASGTPVMLITHQLEEMLFAADHALLIEAGHVLAAGPVETVLSATETQRLLGIDDAGCLLTATVIGREDQLLVADISGETLYIADDGEPDGATLRLRIMARDIALSPKKLDGISVLNQLQAKIISIDEGPSDALVTLALAKPGVTMQSRITRKSRAAMGLAAGDTLYCLIKAVAVKELLSEAP